MNVSSYRRTVASLVILSAALTALGQDKVLLQVKGKEGLFGRYSSETTITMEVAGEKLVLVSKETSKSTVSKVAADGTITFERKQESSDQTVNGEKIPDDGQNPSTTEVVRPDGTLVSMKDDSGEEDPEHLNVRIWTAQAPVFSVKPVGVGDEWTKSFKVDAALGSRAAEAKFKLIAFEEVNGVKCAKISMSYQESGTAPNIKSTVTTWVEVASGDAVKSEYSFEGVPLPGPNGTIAGTAKGTGQRVGGGPVPESGPQAQAEPEPKKIEDVTKGCEKLSGVLTLYKKREAGRQTIYAEITQAQLGQTMMLQTTASSGNSKQIVAGSPISDMVFRFEELQPDRVTIVVPNFGFRAEAGSDSELAVKRSFAESFVEQFNVEARSKERKSLLIDVSDLFRGDISRLSAVLQAGGLFSGGGPSYSLDREKTFVSAVKVFPDNLVVETQYNLVGSGAPTIEEMMGGSTTGDPRSVAVKLVYNLFPLKADTGYVPRLADSRIGYFTVQFQDFSRPTKLDQQTQFVNRWNVRKKNMDEPLSDPVKPIVFWLDNAIPLKYREPLASGILTWNRAFEKIGIKNAIEVKQMPDDADWDPADMRYNTVRWVASAEDAYAVCQSRINPITGETINGSILVDANMVRALVSEQGMVIDPSATTKLKLRDPRACEFVQDGMMQAQIGLIASSVLAIDNRVSADEYVRQFLHNVICHEFGHMLGLRHNFAASTELTLDQLKDKATTDKAQPSASVMDYVPFNVSAIKQAGVDYYGQGLGAYDFWAVEYGYRDFGKDTPTEERSSLQAIASKCNEPGHAFQTDENADGYDPYVTRFDLSAEPLDYWTRMVGLSKTLVSSLGTRKPRAGESYFEMTRELQTLMGFQFKAVTEMTRFIGGLRRNMNFKGDKDERPPLSPLPNDVQVRALDLVCKNAFGSDAFFIPKSYLTKLTDDPNASPIESLLGGQNPYPMFDIVSRFQRAVLGTLMSPSQLNLVLNNEFKNPGTAKMISVGDVFKSVHASVWQEMGSGAAITPLRRELQRSHLQMLINYANKPSSGPSDARMWAWAGLKDLQKAVSTKKVVTTDSTTLVYLDELSIRIQRALDAVDTLGSSVPSRSLADLAGN